MKRLSATSAALTAAALMAAVALPATASTGNGSGGVSPSDSGGQQSADEQQASAAYYRPARASWYGPGFFGRRTACGTVLGHATLGVAHKQLPCGTKVALRYRGRTVVVPVIDRGPYSRGIDYDLTYATAQKLGIQHTSRVRAATLRG
jgi:rare lipoprotein A